jgi:signal transduction histidine kinase
MAISKRLVLRSGFSIIIGLLVISTVMAWRVQENFSSRSFDIHRRYVHEQQILTKLERALWDVGSRVRDYHLAPEPNLDKATADLKQLQQECTDLFSKLRAKSHRTDVIAAVELQFTDMWVAARTALALEGDAAARYAFIQNEIVPRRKEATRLLREIEHATTSTLAATETDFHDTRSGASYRLVVLLGVSLLAGLLVAHFSTRYAERLEQEAQDRFTEVSEAKSQLEHLSARLMEVQEEERTRLSRELHDEIVQNLAVLKMEIREAQAAVARGSDAREPLARARRLAETTVQEVRNISVLLRPSLLDDLGLGPALQWQAEEFTRRTGVPCALRGDVTDNLPDTVKTCVYRVTQEALRNCEKHSRATEVTVTLSEEHDSLEVMVEDNGTGFATDRARRPTSLGVLGMKERASALGGVLHTSNRPNGGAMVRLSLPLVRTQQTEVHA